MKIQGVELNDEVIGRSVVITSIGNVYVTKGRTYEVIGTTIRPSLKIQDNDGEGSCWYLFDRDPNDVQWEWVPLAEESTDTEDTLASRIWEANDTLNKLVITARERGMVVVRRKGGVKSISRVYTKGYPHGN